MIRFQTTMAMYRPLMIHSRLRTPIAIATAMSLLMTTPHHPTEMPKQLDLEACESKKLIESWIGTRVSYFCYPFYRSHAFLADAVKNAGYEQARGGGKPPLYEPGASYYAISNAARFDRFNVDCRPALTDKKRNEIKTRIFFGYCPVPLRFTTCGLPPEA